MFRKTLLFGATLLLAGAAVLTTASPGQARGPGAVHFAGFHAGFYGGGYRYQSHAGFRGYYGYGYHSPYRHWYYPYHYGYYFPYGYGYTPYAYGYSPYGYGYSPYYGSASYENTLYAGPYDGYAPGFNGSVLTSVSPLSDGSGSSGQAETTAHVTVRAPAGADIWINGSNTYSAGPVREFRSVPLTPGYEYTCEFQAQWKDDDGREFSQVRQVTLTAGDHVSVDFPIPDRTRSQAPAAREP